MLHDACRDLSFGFLGDFEIYIALPYIGNIEIDDSPAWMPSVADMVRSEKYGG